MGTAANSPWIDDVQVPTLRRRNMKTANTESMQYYNIF